MSRRNRSAAGPFVGLRARSVAFTLVTLAGTTMLACSTTLEPSVVVVGDGGGNASGGEPLAACSLFTSGGSEYLFCPGRLTNSAAGADCALRSATLTALGSAEEGAFFAATSAPIAGGDWWLGGYRDDASVWHWPDGTAFWRGGIDGMPENGVFTDWKPGEPNNSSTTSPDPERCVALTPAGDWNDRACVLQLSYACERTPQVP